MERVTMQDIADKAGLSRNTVSKIFNNKYNGPNETKKSVLKIAFDMNYRGYAQFQENAQEEVLEKVVEKTVLNILILSKGNIVESNFFAHIVSIIQKMANNKGYNLLLSNVSNKDIEKGILPTNIKTSAIDGIVCLEVFDKDYITKLIKTKIPLVFIEFYYDAWDIPGQYDIVMMNNEFQVYKMVSRLIEDGCTNIGFIGDYRHCRGFYERYMGYTNALRDANLGINPNFSMTIEDGEAYFNDDYIKNYLKNMEVFPDAFVCVNDPIAVNIIKALKELGHKIPEEVQITAFDDLPEVENIRPSLTTVKIHREELGRCAFESLLTRINKPTKQRQVIYVDTDIVVRNSTKKSVIWD
ncbi:MAG TPA: LacI family transcriptional regulator [Epulopiscium sp.]|nr:LacI family transcriptional regulator [Candidatus Epulonipiscium sp.]